jgi:hypothetical protein
MNKYFCYGSLVVLIVAAAALMWRVFDQGLTIDYMKQGMESQRRVCLSLIQVGDTALDLVSAEQVAEKLLVQNGVERKGNGLLVGDIEIEQSAGKMHVSRETCN